MNKFSENLSKSNQSMKQERADRLGKQIAIAQKQLIDDLTIRKLELENKIEEMFDLNESHSTSLEFKKVEDMSKFLTVVQQTKIELEMVKVELKIAKETFKEWFEEN